MLSPHRCVSTALLVRHQNVAGMTKMWSLIEINFFTTKHFSFLCFLISIKFVLKENYGQKRLVEFLCFLHLPSWQTCWANAKKHVESKIWSLFKNRANMKKHKLS